MRLYHGSGQFEQITKLGLVPDSGFRNDFDDEGLLTSLGGTYLTDEVRIAAFYAAKAVDSEASHGMDPCMFIAEVDEAYLAADEDKVWHVIERMLERNGLKFEEDNSKNVSAAATDAFQSRPEFVRELRRELLNDWEAIEDQGIIDAVRAFIVRYRSWEWDADSPGCSSWIEDINQLCVAAAPVSIDPLWLRRNFDRFAMTCRTFKPIVPEGAEAGCRIVGSVCLRMADQGLKVGGIEKTGDISDDEVRVFHDQFVEHTNKISGVLIEPFDFDEFAAEGLVPA